MDGFTQFLQQYGGYLASAVLFALDVASGVYTLHLARSFKALKAKAVVRKTYTVCPHCNQAIPLEDVSFFLPGGKRDDNLNGVPDDEEKGA